jgi:ubiquinone/menaquinone biosynthesis C-methylase UbiE
MNTLGVTDGYKFHDALANSWNDNYQRGGFKKRLAFVRELLLPVVIPGQYWLDAGCGAGILTLEMSKLGAYGLAVDRSSEMISAAITKVGPLSTGFTFKKVVSISTIEVADERFDGVLCSSVIEYLDDIDEALFEMNRVLKIGGKLILSVPNKNSLIRRIQKFMRHTGRVIDLDWFPYLGVSINEFSRFDLLQHLRRCGFLPVTLQGFDPLLPKQFVRVSPPALYFVCAEKVSTNFA